LKHDEEEEYRILNSLSVCFQTIFENVSEETKKKAAKRLIKIITEESEETAQIYLFNLFRCKNLQHLPPMKFNLYYNILSPL